ncbi:hypothetical protein [Desulfosarcina ovata]|uniref:hypothetical protein n=1 Tax=Desulfosarcina ovata TaxID=83564 RepID=UPI0012D33AD7|nr:hypothetical protein [Desulfosarcina ovata]
MNVIPFIRSISMLLFMGILICPHNSFASASTIKIEVVIVKATRNTTTVDPGLEYLVKEVSPLLNFSGFSLLKRSETKLSEKAKEKITLPSNRILEITFLEFSDSQARVLVRILEKGKETFRTILLLVDKGRALIGGPPHDDGVLLLQIGARF